MNQVREDAKKSQCDKPLRTLNHKWPIDILGDEHMELVDPRGLSHFELFPQALKDNLLEKYAIDRASFRKEAKETEALISAKTAECEKLNLIMERSFDKSYLTSFKDAKGEPLYTSHQ